MNSLSFLKYLFTVLAFVFCAANSKAQTGLCTDNIDFEQGSLASWKFFIGTCCPINAVQSTLPVAGRHTLMTGTGTDMYGGFPVVAPGSMFSLKLGNNQIGAQAERALHYLRVPANVTKYIFVFRYAVVFQDPDHKDFEQPRFEVKAYDSTTGALLDCANFSFIASSQLPGFTKSNVGADVYYKPWEAASIDLTSYAGKTVALDFASGDCLLTGHFGYAYVDADCEPVQVQNYSCTGAPTVTLKAPPGFKSYQWRNGALTNIIGLSESLKINTPPVNTTYAVIISPYEGYGCPDTIFMDVIIKDIELDIRHDTTACNGSDMQLNVKCASNALPLTYSWAPSTGLSCTNCQDPVANLQQTITYSVTVTDTNGCTITDTIRVKRVKEVTADILLPDDTVCQYERIELKNIGINPVTAAHFWDLDTNGHVYGDNGKSPSTVWWGTPGRKRIILKTSASFCKVWDTTNIYVRPGPFAYFDMNPNVCINDPLEIRPLKQDAWYYWNIDGQTIKDTLFKTPVKTSFNTLGRKHITLTLKGFNGCDPLPYDTVVTVRELPYADVVVIEDRICYGDTVTLQTYEDKNYIYAWTPVPRFVTNSESMVRAEIKEPIMLHLEVANEWGCRTFDSTYVLPSHCCNVYLPDAFTPNGDGLNDRFKIISVGHHKIHSFMIASRWGKIIYNSTDQYEGWNGTYKGEKQDNGTYFYYLKYDCTDSQTLEEKGSFILIR